LAEARRARIAARGTRVAERREASSSGSCVFIARCPYAREICAQAPMAIQVGPSDADASAYGDPAAHDGPAAGGHLARCWKLTDPEFTPPGGFGPPGEISRPGTA
jgi:hypothetical protein